MAMLRIGIFSARVLFLPLSLSLSITSLSFAVGFDVSPVRIFFTSPNETEALKLSNPGEEKLALQITAFEWSQGDEAQDRLLPTKEIIFFPRIFDLEQGTERLVRIGIKASPGTTEKTYRIFVEELPSEQTVPGMAVRTLLRVGIPVFLAPAKLEDKGVLDRVSLQKGGRVSFRVSNQGTMHFIVKSIKITGYDQQGREIYSQEQVGWYLHAGAAKTYSQGIPPEKCSMVSRIKVDITTDRPSMSETVNAAQGMCAP